VARIHDRRYPRKQRGGEGFLLPPMNQNDAVDLAVLKTRLFRRRHWLLRAFVLAAALLILPKMVLPRQYTAAVAFSTDSKRAGVAQSAAAQLGLSLPVTDGAQSPAFYADLLKSRWVLETIAGGWVRTSDHDSVAVSTLYNVHSPTSEVRIARTAKALAEHLDVVVAQRTGVVGYKITSRAPFASFDLASRLLATIRRFDLEHRQARASSERRFTEGRVDAATQELKEAEGALVAFTEANREVRSSARLQVQYENLQRRVALRNQVLGQLQANLEQARLDEVRDTPVISPIDEPAIPPSPDPLGVLDAFVAALFIALIVGGGVAVLTPLQRESELDESVRDDEGRKLARELRTPWKLFFAPE
jgi:uncharacterized protein involved in exopolysaccharide biosynthesis